ncbi:hypothetical protein HanXRQr2_Chr02g0053381 [Helianthus annuus]|uniref:Uncharacterized protein n=1 Tax=Helianthus annuus TaxID=4232 RepID=A0A9K3NYR8_HELAN|nr:hypothetical protein HanXRQr2_Chr02g0053381 [Helianthus annuus]KAJ0950807.1 hypothetical protein HanPSC8_Chr02g0052481 [Helianthus annuus]
MARLRDPQKDVIYLHRKCGSSVVTFDETPIAKKSNVIHGAKKKFTRIGW